MGINRGNGNSCPAFKWPFFWLFSYFFFALIIKPLSNVLKRSVQEAGLLKALNDEKILQLLAMEKVKP